MQTAERIEETAAQSETRISRTLNPLIYSLNSFDRSTSEHFNRIVSRVVENYGGVTIGIPFHQGVMVGEHQSATFVGLQIPIESYGEMLRNNLRGLLKKPLWCKLFV